MCDGVTYSATETDIDDGFQALVAMFVAELGERASAIEVASASGEWETTKRLAHQLKGAAGGYGFADLGARAAVVERRCADVADLQTRLTAVEKLINACREAAAG